MKLSSSINAVLQSEIDPAFAARAHIIAHTLFTKQPKKVLDTGCGRGFYVRLMTHMPFIREIHGIDVNPSYLATARALTKHDKRVHVQRSSIYSLPFPNNHFDAVVCSEVLEHLDDDKKGLAEIQRVLKPGGTLVVTVPNQNFPFLWDPLNWILMKLFNTHINKDIWWLAGIWADHERLYSTDEIKQLVGRFFTIQKTKTYVSRCWPFTHFVLYGLGKNIAEHLHIKGLSRFSSGKPSSLALLFARLMALPTRTPTDKNVSMGIALVAQKPNH